MGRFRRRTLADFEPIWPEVDELAVDTLLRVASGQDPGFSNDTLNGQSRELEPQFTPLVEEALGRSANLLDKSLAPLIQRVRERAPPQLGLLMVQAAGVQAYPRLVYRREFPDVETVLAWGALVLMDVARPYRRALSRCSRCRRFYLARRNPKGGPANRTYCSPGCREQAHNAARESRRVKAARKHK